MLFVMFWCLFFVQFKPEEITAINGDFNDPGTLAPTGLYLGGTKYMVIQGEPGAVIRGKKVNSVVLILIYVNYCVVVIYMIYI